MLAESQASCHPVTIKRLFGEDLENTVYSEQKYEMSMFDNVFRY